MSNFVRCKEGVHQYDADRYSVCPYCRGYDKKTLGEKKSAENDVTVDETQPIKASPQTAALGPGSVDPTAAIGEADVAAIELPKETNKIQPAPGATRVVRVGSNIKPVTGWLVIVNGPGKGMSHSVFHGVNSIGRDAGQDIQLSLDEEVSRENQAKLTYDEKNNTYYLQHGDGKNITYLNEQPVLEPKKLEAYDVITLGKTECVFVPFCNENFTWDHE